MQRKLPAYPLFIKDPNFSIWQSSDELNAQNAETWFGEKKGLYGFVKSKGKTWCFMGNATQFLPFGVLPAKQTDVRVSLFSTDYFFEIEGVELWVSFVSPLPLNDLDLLSLPVCYMKYEITGDENAELSFFVNRNIAYNTHKEKSSSTGSVRGCVIQQNGFESAFLGLSRQLPLSNTDDRIGADWGYFYLSGQTSFLMDEKELYAYVGTGTVSDLAEDDERYMTVISHGKTGLVMLGYDDLVSINYFGKYCKGYYLENHTILQALQFVWDNLAEIEKKLLNFEQDLKVRAEKFGDKYLDILYASYRQSVGAHKLVLDENGELLWLSKECASNGCIGTVDVSYPSMPLYLLYAPKLVKGMMLPIMKFARMDVWGYDFAPHDVGTYPFCGGQVYGLKQTKGNKYHGKYIYDNSKEKTWTNFPIYLLPKSFEPYDYEKQMPVEECANMLIMTYALYQTDGDNSFFKENKDLFDKWVEYLVKYGLKPENQLCTDDFAGRLKNNINLAIKATVAIGCYAKLLEVLKEDGVVYRKLAEEYAKEISEFSEEKGWLPISWDCDNDTFSLKYNLAFDKILKLGLFGEKVYEREVECYIEKMNEFGIPLDNRAVYTKSDWLIWTAYFAPEKIRDAMIDSVHYFLTNSPSRVPFADWYDTDTGKAQMFKARSVQSGCFILLMEELIK